MWLGFGVYIIRTPVWFSDCVQARTHPKEVKKQNEMDLLCVEHFCQKQHHHPLEKHSVMWVCANRKLRFRWFIKLIFRSINFYRSLFPDSQITSFYFVDFVVCENDSLSATTTACHWNAQTHTHTHTPIHIFTHKPTRLCNRSHYVHKVINWCIKLHFCSAPMGPCRMYCIYKGTYPDGGSLVGCASGCESTQIYCSYRRTAHAWGI
jgi:hypothetical protein